MESAPSQPRKPGELKIARQEPIRASTSGSETVLRYLQDVPLEDSPQGLNQAADKNCLEESRLFRQHQTWSGNIHLRSRRQRLRRSSYLLLRPPLPKFCFAPMKPRMILPLWHSSKRGRLRSMTSGLNCLGVSSQSSC